jgi:16S rRNA (guanine1516-N2)-methyltransferase
MEKAERLACELQLPLAQLDDARFPLLLVAAKGRLELQVTGRRPPGPVYVDFLGGAVDYRRRRGGGRRQLIARAVGVGQGTDTVLDATAGLGRDAFALACLGCAVTAVERSPVLAAMLRDGLARARAEAAGEVRIILERLTLLHADSRAVLESLSESDKPDVVYVDPMYPVDERQSALVKKEMRICRMLIGDDEDAGALLSAGRRAARRRVVVKRQLHAPVLAADCDGQYVGRRIRYDVYHTHRSTK